MPALSERLPALLRPCSLVTFSLGKKPPRLGPLQVAPFDTSDYHGVQLDIDVDGDLDLEFTMRIGALEAPRRIFITRLPTPAPNTRW